MLLPRAMPIKKRVSLISHYGNCRLLFSSSFRGPMSTIFSFQSRYEWLHCLSLKDKHPRIILIWNYVLLLLRTLRLKKHLVYLLYKGKKERWRKIKERKKNSLLKTGNCWDEEIQPNEWSLFNLLHRWNGWKASYEPQEFLGIRGLNAHLRCRLANRWKKWHGPPTTSGLKILQEFRFGI